MGVDIHLGDRSQHECISVCEVVKEDIAETTSYETHKGVSTRHGWSDVCRFLGHIAHIDVSHNACQCHNLILGGVDENGQAPLHQWVNDNIGLCTERSRF